MGGEAGGRGEGGLQLRWGGQGGRTLRAGCQLPDLASGRG